jgi:hypothetical protein
MRSKAKAILTEAPIDYGGTPDYIHPEKKRRIERGGHPYGEGFPSELAASEAYPEIVRKVERYTGQRLRSPRDVQQVLMQMQQAVMTAMRIEQGHEQELAQAAVDLVLDLPEFRGAREAVERGDLRIEAELTSDINLQRASLEAEPDDPENTELQVPEIVQELGSEVTKRRFINAMIQGNAINKNFAYHLAADKLREVDPRLLDLYGTMMSVGEFAYWIFPDEQLKQFMGGGQAAGAAHIETGQDGVPVIRAQARVFPVLVQELTKALMEYLSHGEDEDPETRRYVHGKADTLDAEQWDIMLGPGMWRRFLRAIGEQNHDLIPYIYDHLVQLPAEEFRRVVNEIIKHSPEGQRYLQNLIAQIRQESQQESQQESAKNIISKLD